MSRKKQEESVYDWSQLGATGAGVPRMKTYHVPAPAAGPKVKMHSDSSQVESILNPVRGIRDAQTRAGITPTNHSRHNILAIKEQSRLNALQKIQQQEDLQTAHQQQFRRSTSGSNSGSAAGSRVVSRTSSLGAARQLSRNDGSSGGSRNFVEENRASAAAASRPIKAAARSDDGSTYMQKDDYGLVPTYLLQRKMQLAQEQEALQAAKVAAQIPAGLRQMPEAERLETLKLLQANRAKIEARLSALPIIIETPTMIRHKDELERRLREIEDAHRIFSRPNVLVHATSQ